MPDSELLGHHDQCRATATRRRTRSASTPRCARRSSSSIDREAINQVVFNGEFVPGNQWVSPENSYYQKSLPIPKRDVAKAKALIKEAGVTTPIAIDFMVPQGAENKAISEVVQAMAAEAGFDMKIRVTEFATSLKSAEAGDYQAYLIGWSGRTDPDGNLYIFHKPARRRRTTAAIATRRSTSCSTRRGSISDPAKRKAIYEKVAKILLERGPRSSISITARC